MSEPAPQSEDTQRLLDQARAGDRDAFDRLFAQHRDYLVRLVELRLDRRLRVRVDPSDVVQDAHLEAFRRLPAFLEHSPMPFRLWLRQIAHERMLKVRRQHLQTARRNMAREVPLPDASALAFARELLAAGSSPSQQLSQKEVAERIQQALATLAEADHEVLVLRNFEGLAYEEIGYLLGIEAAAARKRHGRALLRLHKALFGGGTTEADV